MSTCSGYASGLTSRILVITGGETDVCVAIDLGYRVILVENAVCSSDDQTCDASLEFLRNRFSVELELMATDDFLQQARG
ncbi:isochorismatase-like domain-containing protein [Rhizobium gallicum bv. gallicum R602sp]|uniref:Isochorismatase-like domain-containing protein n=1 Tax=Rhizobium gallicum bv. gallicum R602sp TaxID=1041138 RepID=A0A0B4X901_9HYPH|nr:isochorismatase-like domain-containing protein [Rhizobium gallicum bv. gallicum R602sp]